MITKDETELDPLQRLALQDFSYSRINTYLECPAKYFYSYVLKEPADFGTPALLGNVIHKALEITLEDGEKIDLRELLQNYNAVLTELDSDDTIPNQMIADGEEMLRQYVDDHSGKVEVYAKELPFSFVLGPARFNGFIDLVSLHNSFVRVRDYKTGRQEIAYKSAQTNLQLGIYSLYMKRLFPYKDIYAEVYYLRTSKAKGHLFTDEDLTDLEIRLHELVTEIVSRESFPVTADTRACRFCSYGRDGVCPTGQLRLRRQNLLKD